MRLFEFEHSFCKLWRLLWAHHPRRAAVYPAERIDVESLCFSPAHHYSTFQWNFASHCQARCPLLNRVYTMDLWSGVCAQKELDMDIVVLIIIGE